MKPKRISQSLIFIKCFLLVFGLIFFFISFAQTKPEEMSICIVIGLSIISFAIYLLFNPQKIEFDENSMYVIKKKETTVIPLDRFYKIKLTMTEINNMNLWKVSYLNDEGQQMSIRFLPKVWSFVFDDFKKQVSLKNPAVTIQNWSHSFDLDQ